MNRFRGVEIKKLLPVEKHLGNFTYELCKGQISLQITVCKRSRGSVFAKHCHKGLDLSKNPERLFLISGGATLNAYDGLSDRTLKTVVKDGHEILVSPNILHELKAVSDVIFLEFRPTVFNAETSDTYPAETYEKYIKSLSNSKNILNVKR